MRRVFAVLGLLAGLLIVGALSLPSIFSGMGLHPHYPIPDDLDVSGRKALIITTSHNVLGESGNPTGVFASEMTAPYYAFKEAGMDVTVASVAGGKIPIDPTSFLWFLKSDSDDRYLNDPVFQAAVESSVGVSTLNGASYDIVFLAGGWGAAYDLGVSEHVGRVVTEAWAAGSVVGGVCHGPLGLLKAKDQTGRPLAEGRRLTAVTDKQVRELGIDITPQHPERELRAAGAIFESSTAIFDGLANHVASDGRLVTGQNQNAGTETAVLMMRTLEEKVGRLPGDK